ncbi:MAG TPA: hypothetical protein DFS52_16965 [Myxococcales bacterium]|jgi:rubrerythrin|nr:hypothetical protein [Myxococcales bacterium]
MAKNPTQMGTNRTGIATSPIDSKAMIDSAKSATPTSQGDESNFANLRTEYINRAGQKPVGAIPPPTSLKGAAQAVGTLITGKRPQVLIDMLGERLAFERMGSRIYEALLAKMNGTLPPGRSPNRQEVEEFRDQEVRHFQLLKQTMENMGLDPTVETPSADLSGVESAGLLQVLSDPRTNIEQCLHALLVAELADYDGWETLIQLTDALGQTGLSNAFGEALRDEENHLRAVRRWYADNISAEAGVQLQMP